MRKGEREKARSESAWQRTSDRWIDEQLRCSCLSSRGAINSQHHYVLLSFGDSLASFRPKQHHSTTRTSGGSKQNWAKPWPGGVYRSSLTLFSVLFSFVFYNVVLRPTMSFMLFCAPDKNKRIHTAGRSQSQGRVSTADGKLLPFYRINRSAQAPNFYHYHSRRKGAQGHDHIFTHLFNIQ